MPSRDVVGLNVGLDRGRYHYFSAQTDEIWGVSAIEQYDSGDLINTGESGLR